jgi:hypothetical protein
MVGVMGWNVWYSCSKYKLLFDKSTGKMRVAREKMVDSLEIVEWPSVMLATLFSPAHQGQMTTQLEYRNWFRKTDNHYSRFTGYIWCMQLELYTCPFHALSLQHLNVTLVNCSRIQHHIRQIKSDIFQLQTGIQNLMTRLDLACTVKQHHILATPNALYELCKIYLPQNFAPCNSTLGWNWMTYTHLNLLLHQP